MMIMRNQARRSPWGWAMQAVGAALMLGAAAAAASVPPATKTEDNKAFETALRHELETLTAKFATTTRMGELTPLVDGLFDAAIAYCPATDEQSPLRDINALRRQIVQLTALKQEDIETTRKILGENPKLARAVSGAIGPGDNVPSAYAVMRLLATAFPERVLDKKEGAPSDPKAHPAGKKDKSEDLSNLVAAFCIVYDGPMGDKPQPLLTERIKTLFNHFSANAGKMGFPAATTPPELLAFVVSVDSIVTEDDLSWALKSYQGNKTVGKLYQTIVYDTMHFKHGTPKKVEKAPGGVTLQNIKKFGGVCVEQALFASNVGRIIGVPAVSVTGRGSDVGHAWVGYLKSAGNNKYEWDFDEGRYKEYQGLKGNVVDPRTGKSVADGYIGLTAGLMGTAAVREQSTALLDAADRLQVIEATKLTFPPSLPAGVPASKTPAIALGIKSQLALIEQGLRKLPANTRGWSVIAEMANAKRLPTEDLRTWSERVIELCGNDYPDFAFDALNPMARAVTDINEQDHIWEWLINKLNKRKDLAAAAILCRADMWDKNKNPAKAWDYYHDVIERYPNDGQIIVDALSRAERFLLRENKNDDIVGLYGSAWTRISKPSQMSPQFTAASSWVIVGKRYADLLDKSGKKIDAKKVRDQIDQVLSK